MSVNAILVPLSGQASDDAVVRIAGDLATSFSAALDFVHIGRGYEQELVAVGDSGFGAIANRLLDVAVADREDRAARARAAYDRWVALARDAGLPADRARWRDGVGQPGAQIARLGRLADLLVMARTPADDPTDMCPEEVAAESGRPVLVVPQASPGTDRPRRIAIAWDGGPSASRAVAAALPLLKVAARVVVVTVEETRGPADAPDLRPYLERHGIDASVLRPLSPRDQVPSRLVAACDDIDADLLVLGAGARRGLHRLLRRRIARDVLADIERPVLLSA